MFILSVLQHTYSINTPNRLHTYQPYPSTEEMARLIIFTMPIVSSTDVGIPWLLPCTYTDLLSALHNLHAICARSCPVSLTPQICAVGTSRQSVIMSMWTIRPWSRAARSYMGIVWEKKMPTLKGNSTRPLFWRWSLSIHEMAMLAPTLNPIIPSYGPSVATYRSRSLATCKHDSGLVGSK